MDNSNLKQENIVEGFSFSTERDAALAATEQKKIEYLEERMNYDNPAGILNIYQKAIRERVFKTPIGLEYLKHLQEYLQTCTDIDPSSILPIPLYKNYDGEFRQQPSPARYRIKPTPKKKSIALPVSVMLNIVLIVAVIAMFFITLKADQPNILNYERALTDRYATWEQELTEREQAIREKERELKLQEPLN